MKVDDGRTGITDFGTLLNLNPLKQVFPKQEKLTSKKIIKELFQKGSSIYLYPFRILYIQENIPVDPSPQVLFTVPKKYSKKAVDRNVIKRRIREAYRLNKSALFLGKESNKPTYLAFIYIAKEANTFEIIEKKMILALKRLVN